ncbi:MAG TPA: HAMP domain-containing sensor histidine kinase [Solirubrobacteraceae bacterium]|nr:HAMP domain-containing sensor histidine kinase [Solirubrobacteraceae bacterium]
MRRALGVGLRPRLLAALLLTSAISLSVAAFALLGPLDQRLERNTSATLVTAALTTRTSLADEVDRNGQLNLRVIARICRDLGRRTGARVALVDAHGQRVFDTDPDIVDPFDDSRLALSTSPARTVHDKRFGRLRVAAPLKVGGARYVLVLRKRLTDVASASGVVQDAFLKAAAVGLVIALLVGIGFTTTLLRRLERLRDSTREMETVGLEAPAPVDHSHDEVGELSRAFASMQSKLRRQEAARRAFVATASHELRTPLASLDGMLELLADDLTDPLDLDDARERTGQAQEQSRRLGQLASDLLDLSRIDAALELRSEPIEVAELCRAVVAEFQRRAAARVVPLDFVAPDLPCWAMGDPGSVARIVRILIDNALRISGEHGAIEVSVAERDDEVSVYVRDDGPGVPVEEREMIFERFQRGRNASGEGFGLGLAIGRELAGRMGGRLELRDPPSGRGACFALCLERAAVEEAAGAPA